jgi:hypothetical protein
MQQSYTDPSTGQIYVWNPYTASYEVSGYDPNAYQQSLREPVSEYEQFLMDWYPEQLQQEQQLSREQLAAQTAYQNQQIALQKQAYEAQLASQPKSWLEYAAYTGQNPAVQPWMLPLMSQEYSQLQAGQQIPGWSQSGGTAMPELINPSAQYLARMGPTAQQQWLGYQQAQTGAPADETTWRAQLAAPPGGSTWLNRYR